MPDECGDDLRRARSAARAADRALRESVVRARLANRSWTEIGLDLGVSRQAARERFLALEQLGKARARVHQLIDQLAKMHGTTAMETVGRLVADGTLNARKADAIEALEDRYEKALDGAVISSDEADRLTDDMPAVTSALFVAMARTPDFH